MPHLLRECEPHSHSQNGRTGGGVVGAGCHVPNSALLFDLVLPYLHMAMDLAAYLDVSNFRRFQLLRRRPSHFRKQLQPVMRGSADGPCFLEPAPLQRC